MRQEYGRSLIEIIGVMAIAAITTASAIGMYRMLHANSVRKIANAQMEQIAHDVKLLMEMRGDYTGVSVDYLAKAGALKSDAAPIGGAWSVTAGVDGKTFEINLTELTVGECDYFITAMPKWATSMRVNGTMVDAGANACFNSPTNQVSFIVQ